MKAITIRGIEPDVAKKLKLTASKQNKSINQLVLEFIKKNLEMKKVLIDTDIYSLAMKGGNCEGKNKNELNLFLDSPRKGMYVKLQI